MAMFHTIKQLEEKSVANEINCMVWSDRMDLVAFSNTKGEVALHRLTWTKAWILHPPKEGLIVKGISWRPDGKILAIAYNSGQILLVNVENIAILHTLETGSDISCIYWVQEKLESKNNTDQYLKDAKKSKDYMKYVDYSSNFISETPNSTESVQSSKLSNLLQNQSELNLLLVGSTEGCIKIYIFGCFLCATLNLNAHLGHKCDIQSVHLNEHLSKMFVTVKNPSNNNVKLIFLDSGLFKTHTKELFATALKYAKLLNLMNYLSNTITTITESWENILIEMDNKLSKYASNVAEGGVTADFLDLLMFGICSNEMEEFLVHDLTKKGLEKLGQTIELSYTNIQEMLLNYVTEFGQNVTYHLAELRGMARLEHRYEIVGLEEEHISEAILSNGSFLIKAGEMQQIINHSIINYNAFFRWLYTAIIHLLDEQVVTDIPKMTQQDLAHIAEFLQNFDHIGKKGESDGQTKFIMERLGQYLSEDPLTIPSNMSGNDWANFVEQNDCIRNNPNIFKHDLRSSLINQYKKLKISIDNIFASPEKTMSQKFKFLQALSCFSSTDRQLSASSINLNKDTILFAFLQPPQHIFLLQVHENNDIFYGRCGKFHFSQFLSYDQEAGGENYNILDTKFYSNTILSILLEENTNRNLKVPVLYQFPIPAALERLREINLYEDIFESNIPSVEGSNFSPKLFKNIEGMVALEFAVSGIRRVSIVLSENRRKVRLFEMEGEDEEDEDGDMSASVIKENDVNMQDETL